MSLYLVGVVILVRRQIYQIEEEESEELVVVVDKEGKTGIKIVEKVLNDENIVFT